MFGICHYFDQCIKSLCLFWFLQMGEKVGTPGLLIVPRYSKLILTGFSIIMFPASGRVYQSQSGDPNQYLHPDALLTLLP